MPLCAALCRSLETKCLLFLGFGPGFETENRPRNLNEIRRLRGAPGFVSVYRRPEKFLSAYADFLAALQRGPSFQADEFSGIGSSLMHL